MRSICRYPVALILLITFACGSSLSQDENSKDKASAENKHLPHTEFAIILAAIAVSGAIGGLATGIGSRRTNELCLPMWRPNNGSVSVLRLGFVGDMFIGTTASFAVHFVLDPITDSQPDSMQVRYLMRSIAMGVLAGFMGIKVLSTLSDTFMKQLQDKGKQIMDEVQTQNKSAELLRFTENSLKDIDKTEKSGDLLRAMIDLDNAEAGVDQILAQSPNNTQALVIKAKVFRRRWEYNRTDPKSKQFLEQGINILSNALKIDPVYDRAYYNRACYHALLGHTDEAMKDLQQAVSLFSQNRFFAKDDTDLVSLRNHKEWKNVVDSL